MQQHARGTEAVAWATTYIDQVAGDLYEGGEDDEDDAICSNQLALYMRFYIL